MDFYESKTVRFSKKIIFIGLKLPWDSNCVMKNVKRKGELCFVNTNLGKLPIITISQSSKPFRISKLKVLRQTS